jgi:hypothetical protein
LLFVGGKFVKFLIPQKLGEKKTMETDRHYFMDNNNKRQNDYLMDYLIDEYMRQHLLDDN